MDLLCYVPTGWTFKIRPAEAKREWMDRTADAFAYRCLPLNIANAHGWEVLAPSSFEAMWNGGSNRADLTIRMIGQHEPAYAPVSLFGNGVLTIHMHGLFRTPPGWNLWVSGPPNLPKDGIYPLTGIVETDWSPYTFTMNWQVTRPHHWIRFDKGEPVCFFFPVRRGLLESIEPRIVAFEKNPELLRQFNDWRESRDTFYKTLPAGSGTGDSWQKRYYRGVDMHDRCPVADHETKLRVNPFVAGDEPARPNSPTKPDVAAAGAPPPDASEVRGSAAPAGRAGAAPSARQPAAPAGPSELQRQLQAIGVELMLGAEPAPLVQRLIALGAPEAEARRIIETATNDPLIVKGRTLARALRARDRVLSGLEHQRRLAPSAAQIERRSDVSENEFLERYYAPSRPVILVDLVSDWPALARWTPEYLGEKLGSHPAGVSGGNVDPDSDPTRKIPLAQFMDLVQSGRSGSEQVAVLDAGWATRVIEDLGTLELLSDRDFTANAELHVGGSGARLGTRQAQRNSLLAQIAGRRHLALRAAGDVAEATAAAPPPYQLTLSPGETLFLPFGWWHESQSLGMGFAVSFFNFKWPNDFSDPPRSP